MGCFLVIIEVFLGSFLWASIEEGSIVATIITILLMGGIVAIYSSATKKRKKELKDTIDLLRKLSEDHGRTLAIKRKQILRKNEYGAIEKKRVAEWEKELTRFIDSTPIPLLLNNRDHLVTHLKDFMKIVDSVAESHQKELLFDVSEVDSQEYEVMCAEILKKQGWDAEVTKGSGDQGVDIVASKDGKKVVLQCKLYSRPVGNKAVQEVAAGRSHYGGSHAAVVSNAGFTKSAQELAQSTDILLLNHEDLQTLDSLVS